MFSRPKKTVLITGFGIFPGVSENPSERMAHMLAAQAGAIWPHLNFVTHIFDTDWNTTRPEINDLLTSLNPVFALHFGVGSQKHALHIERQARNLASGDADIRGCPGCCGPIHPGSPERLKSTLPLHPILRELRARSIPAHISNNAGSYLCNYLFYNALLHSGSRTKSPVTGFIHLPTCVMAQQKTNCHPPINRTELRLSWPQLMEAGSILLRHSLQKARVAQPLHSKTCSTSSHLPRK